MTDYKSLREELIKESNCLINKMNDLYKDKLKNRDQIQELWKKVVLLKQHSEALNYLESDLIKYKIDDYYMIEGQ